MSTPDALVEESLRDIGESATVFSVGDPCPLCSGILGRAWLGKQRCIACGATITVAESVGAEVKGKSDSAPSAATTPGDEGVGAPELAPSVPAPLMTPYGVLLYDDANPATECTWHTEAPISLPWLVLPRICVGPSCEARRAFVRDLEA